MRRVLVAVVALGLMLMSGSAGADTASDAATVAADVAAANAAAVISEVQWMGECFSSTPNEAACGTDPTNNVACQFLHWEAVNTKRQVVGGVNTIHAIDRGVAGTRCENPDIIGGNPPQFRMYTEIEFLYKDSPTSYRSYHKDECVDPSASGQAARPVCLIERLFPSPDVDVEIQKAVRKAVFTVGVIHADGTREPRATREFGPILQTRCADDVSIGSSVDLRTCASI